MDREDPLSPTPFSSGCTLLFVKLAQSAKLPEHIIHDVTNVGIIKSDDLPGLQVINDAIIANAQTVKALKLAAERFQIQGVSPTGSQTQESQSHSPPGSGRQPPQP